VDSIVIFFEIVLINLLLSGDNAIVIAMVSSQLPAHQRTKVIWWGTSIAVILRCLLISIALPLLQIPFLQAIGGLLLFYIAIKLIVDVQQSMHNSNHPAKLTLIGAVWTIVTADFVMSLDNVIAIAAVAHGDLVLIMLGIAISIPMIIWGSNMFDKWMKKYPFLSFIGAALLAFAAGEMFIKDTGLINLLFNKMQSYTGLIPLLCVPLVIIIAIMRLKTNDE